MARTAVTATALPGNTAVAEPAGTTIDATLVTNGVVISGVPLEELVIEITNTFAGNKTATVQSGDTTDGAFEGGLGDLGPTTFAQNAVKKLGPFTSGRFSNGGALWVDFEAGFTGTIKAFWVKRAA